MDNRYQKLTQKPPAGKAAAAPDRAAISTSGKGRKTQLAARELTDGQIAEMAAKSRLERTLAEKPLAALTPGRLAVIVAKRPPPRRRPSPPEAAAAEPKPRPKSPAGGAIAKYGVDP